MQSNKKHLSLLLLFFVVGCSSSGNDWEELINEDMEGWHVYQDGKNFNGWYVEDDVLVFDPARRTKPQSSSLVTDKKHTDFELSMEWMISENGNSGVFWGVFESGKYEHAYETGPEIQILDDGYKTYIEERGDINRAGALYNLLPPKEIVSKPAGEWNKYLIHIDQTNNEGFVEFNGTKILEFPVNGEPWKEMVAESDFADWGGFGKYQTGHICLQDHGSKVAFRNIKIRAL